MLQPVGWGRRWIAPFGGPNHLIAFWEHESANLRLMMSAASALESPRSTGAAGSPDSSDDGPTHLALARQMIEPRQHLPARTATASAARPMTKRCLLSVRPFMRG